MKRRTMGSGTDVSHACDNFRHVLDEIGEGAECACGGGWGLECEGEGCAAGVDEGKDG